MYHLILATYQTPDVEHEENWVALVVLASVQLWLGCTWAGVRLCPWERYLPRLAAGVASPSQMQRDWERISRQIGRPAKAPKRRGKSSGRARGTRQATRQRRPVVKKAQKACREAISPT